MKISNKLSLQSNDSSRSELLKAFTLVELIVVIVILAILTTIASLNFGSQVSSSRDSVRVIDITNLSK
jgi:prepilin-type N-terminal cleavage/methylation domain-containing protein